MPETKIPTITSNALPPNMRPAQPAPDIEIAYEDIEAKPLRAPNFVNLLPKNPNIALYWGNRAVGEKESCLRYDQLIAMGFVPAKPEDVYVKNPETGEKLPCPPSIARDGRVMYGDIILLKHSRKDYIGALKWNEQSARIRIRKPGVTIEGAGASKDMGGKEVLKTDGRAQVGSAGFPNKAHVYVPPIAEVDSRTADNSGPVAGADGRPLNLATK
jgi:hypothetical protein